MAWQGRDNASSDGNEPTGFWAAMAWQGKDNASSNGDEPTGFQAAMALQGNNDQPTMFLIVFTCQGPQLQGYPCWNNRGAV